MIDSADIENERKFLVIDTSIISDDGSEGTSIVQGYFTKTVNGASARIRYYPTLNTYQLTAKGPRSGISRIEREQEVNSELGELLLLVCDGRVIEKTRYPIVGPDGSGWDVDVFHGANSGLVLAEIELPTPTTPFAIPPWCGEDVTHDDRYYNENLAITPYTFWTV